MIKNSLKILAILFLLVLNLSFFAKFSLYSFAPNLIIGASIVLLLRGFLKDGMLVAAVGGLLLDLVSPFYFGIYTLSLIVIFLFLHFIVLKNIPTLNPIFIFLIFFGLFLFIDFILSFAVRHFPNWQIFIDVSLNSGWAMLLYYFSEKFISQEEIKFS